VNLSYRGKLSWSESITKGKFFSGRCDGEKIPCEISLEESYARRMNVNIGDKLTFDVSGIDIVGVVTSFRKVKWTSFEPNFFILFQPGLLEEAPKTFLASFKVKSIEERREIFQLISNNFANVSLLEVSEVVRKITEIFELMAFSIKIISFLSLAVALVVVWAVSFNHLELKIKEMKLFFLMGMTAEKRETIYKIESFLLTSMSIGLAIFSGTLITFLVLSFGFNITLEIRALYLISFLIILFIILNALLLFKIRNLVKRSEKALITF
jgi:putative ABC transport system permease protein